MAIQNLSEHVLLITLPAEPQSAGTEAEMAMRSAGARPDCDVIVDFSLVEIMSSATLCNLLILERHVEHDGPAAHPVLRPRQDCQASSRRVGLHKLFRFADDEFAAVQSLDRRACP